MATTETIETKIRETKIREAEIREAESRLRTSMLASDVNELDELIEDELSFICPEGRWLTKEDDLEVHRSGAFRIDVLEVKEQAIRILESSVAVCVSLVHLSFRHGETEVRGDFRYTRVWRESGGEWKVAAGHCSACV